MGHSAAPTWAGVSVCLTMSVVCVCVCVCGQEKGRRDVKKKWQRDLIGVTLCD